jgi:hypothetical protein
LAIRTLGDAIDASMGDLLGGTTGQVLAKTSNTDMDFTWSTPSAGSSYVAGKNAFFNSAFDIWQRGTSSTGGAYNYTADRWLNFRGAFAAGATFSQIASTQAGFRYALRAQRDSGNSATDVLHLRQALETNDSLRFQGQTVTVSFYARAGADFSATSDILVSTIYQGEGTDQATNNMTAWTGVTAIAQNNTLTTSWQRFTQTTTISSAKTQFGIAFTYTPTGTAGAADNYDITGVQVEIAATASGFSRQTGSIQGELAACQRYYTRLANVSSATEYWFGSGYAGSTTEAQCILPLTSTMRSSTITLDYSGVRLQDYGAGYAISALIYVSSARNNIVVGATSTGLTANRPMAIDTTTTGYIGISAEL